MTWTGVMGNKTDLVTPDTSPGLINISEEAILIFTWIVYSVVCQIIDIFGIVTNIINIICFIKQGFKDSINVSLLGLSISDLGCLITSTWTNMFVTPALRSADPPFEPMEVYYLISAVPHLSFSRVTSWITAIITMERCLCVMAPLKIKEIVTSKRTSVIVVSIFVILFVGATPTYIVNKLGLRFSAARNKTMFGLISTDERERVEAISFIVNNFSIPLTAFTIILVCTITLAFKLDSTVKWRKKSTAPSQADRVSTSHQKVAKMVVTISTLFILCFSPICIGMLAAAIEPELYVSGKYIYIAILAGGVSFIFESVNSSVNIFIYYHMSSKYKITFLHIFCKHKG